VNDASEKMHLRPVAVLADAPFSKLEMVLEDAPSPDVAVYGLEQILSFGYKPLSSGKFSGRATSKLRDVIEHRLGYPIEMTIRSWLKVSKSGLVLGILEHNVKLALMLKRRGVGPFKNAKIVVLNCWLAERLPKMSEQDRIEWIDLLNHADAVTVWSKNQIEILSNLGVNTSLLHPLEFGVNPWLKNSNLGSNRDIDVVAVGMDAGRDYKTLFEAVSGQPWRVKLACKPVNLTNLDIPENVEILGLIPRDQYRELLQRAKVVVVPTHEFAYPTGQSVALEGAMAGAAIVVSNTQPMREYFTDGITALMPEVHSVEGVRLAINRLLGDESLRQELAARGAVNTAIKYTNRRMWQEVAQILDQIAGASPLAK
jgi:glycosyltransferase involved in cell wall biosynthesis